ncbi:ATP-binding cassette, subfamily G (WHITE), member 2 [Marchantia polymorpha subsp. ruderalis]|uniref:ABC transporter domain-containing protein n=1 Tax=Marchantia polymorpha TaxID=3197 RepID=A0A2R6XM61_MARPO|nr:hypothetical protein MARPO_0008s0003 [Marchantia polymorpha]BBN19617.1 hypothetical protein Mp_8g12130 [Marchantia polymorpha subsp. ruderalis]|eukprot:PTQ47207.1 hypothetical protein MARPO_0008s0003 [Marchantia polymorpha]
MDAGEKRRGVVTDDERLVARLSWKNLSAYIDNDVRILHDLSGYVEPGRICAIMGPSGSGKSTLLDSLAGRISKNITLTGDIRLNGRSTRVSYGTAAYLAQECDLLGTLTVKETIYYSAKLRLPSSTTTKDMDRIVKSTIEEVGLQDSINTPIGNWHQRGLSGGEKRRVSIAIALLTRPRLLFLDEPTSGLDSASSFHVVSTLRNLAHDGRTVLCSIHQPSSQVFQLFDILCLLSGGKQIYFGDLPGSLTFFKEAGYPCPSLQNPADHYLLCVNSDFDKVQKSLQTILEHRKEEGHAFDEEEAVAHVPQFESVAAVVRSLTHAYSESQNKLEVESHIQEMNKAEGPLLSSSGSEANFFTQVYTLTMRSFTNMNRDFGYYWLRLGMYIVLTLAIGTIFFKAGYSYTAIAARAACVSFVVAFLTFMSVGGFPSFIEDMKVFTMERLNGHYGVAAFVLGNTLSSVPFLLLISLISTVIVYFLVDLHHGAEYFFYFVLSLFSCLLVVESLMMAIASLVPNFLMGIIIGAGIQVSTDSRTIYLILSGATLCSI